MILSHSVRADHRRGVQSVRPRCSHAREAIRGKHISFIVRGGYSNGRKRWSRLDSEIWAQLPNPCHVVHQLSQAILTDLIDTFQSQVPQYPPLPNSPNAWSQGCNGSGKHNNWSLFTNEGVNLLNVGQLAKKSGSSEIFPVIMAAIVKAVDEVNAYVLCDMTRRPGVGLTMTWRICIPF